MRHCTLRQSDLDNLLKEGMTWTKDGDKAYNMEKVCTLLGMSDESSKAYIGNAPFVGLLLMRLFISLFIIYFTRFLTLHPSIQIFNLFFFLKGEILLKFLSLGCITRRLWKSYQIAL